MVWGISFKEISFSKISLESISFQKISFVKIISFDEYIKTPKQMEPKIPQNIPYIVLKKRVRSPML